MATDPEYSDTENGVRASLTRSRLSIWFYRSLLAVTAVVMFFLMDVTFVDVVERYVFDRPIRGGFEIVQF